MKKKAFTLIELLVVISIIAILMAIMMPALNKVRKIARSAVCKSNQKNIVRAAQLWTADNDGWAVGAFWSKPDDTDWYGSIDTSIEPYTNSSHEEEDDLYICPSAKEETEYLFTWEGFDGERGKKVNYAVNGWMVCALEEGSPGTQGVRAVSDFSYRAWGENDVYAVKHGATKIHAVRRPSDTLYFTDHPYHYIADSNFNPAISPWDLPHGKFKGTAARWHERKEGEIYGYCNIAWVDGHVSKEPDGFGDTRDDGYEIWRYYVYDH